MSEGATRSRGDREIDLGSLGKVTCRPGLRALEAIDSHPGSGSLSEVLRRLAMGVALRDVVTIVYETHLDFAAASKDAKRYSRAQIAEAALEVGINTLKDACWDLVSSAFAFPRDEGAEGDQGNG